MRTFLLVCLLFTVAPPALAQIPGPAASGVPVMLSPPTSPPPSAQSVTPVATPAAPPTWAQDIMVTAQGLPFIGPLVSKALLWLGILSSIVTAFVAFLLTAIAALSKVLKLSGLADAAAAVTAFRDGKIVYWLKYLSMFNAKAPAPPADSTKSA